MDIRIGSKPSHIAVGAIFALLTFSLWGQTGSYDDLLTQAKSALTAKNYKEAVMNSQKAISMDDRRWEAYAIAANAYSGQRLYDDAIGMLQMALSRAPEERKQLVRDALQEVRKQQMAGPSSSPSSQAPTQAEIVLWKSIENSARSDDFAAYLQRYPDGTYASLARTRIDAIQRDTADRIAAQRKQLAGSRWTGRTDFVVKLTSYNHIPVSADSTQKGHHSLMIDLRLLSNSSCSEASVSRQPCSWEQNGNSVTVRLIEDKENCPHEFTLTVDGTEMTGIMKNGTHGGFHACKVGGEDQVTLHRVD
jgi:hypothetical protein